MSTELCLTQYLFEKVSILVHLFILSYKSFLSVISVKKALSEYCENYRDISLTPLPPQLAKYLCSSRLGYDAGSSQCVHALCHVSWTIVWRPGAEAVTTLHNTRSCCKLGDRQLSLYLKMVLTSTINNCHIHKCRQWQWMVRGR